MQLYVICIYKLGHHWALIRWHCFGIHSWIKTNKWQETKKQHTHNTHSFTLHSVLAFYVWIFYYSISVLFNPVTKKRANEEIEKGWCWFPVSFSHVLITDLYPFFLMFFQVINVCHSWVETMKMFTIMISHHYWGQHWFIEYLQTRQANRQTDTQYSFMFNT